MAEIRRFVVWVDRSRRKHLWRCPNRNGALLLFDEEEPARFECDRLNARSSNSYMRYSVKRAPKPAAAPRNSGLAWS